MIAEQYTDHIDIISGHHLVLTVIMDQPGTNPLFHEENEQVDSLEKVYQALGGHLRWRDVKGVERKLRRYGVDLKRLSNERLCSALVTEYVNIKQRQRI